MAKKGIGEHENRYKPNIFKRIFNTISSIVMAPLALITRLVQRITIGKEETIKRDITANGEAFDEQFRGTIRQEAKHMNYMIEQMLINNKDNNNLGQLAIKEMNVFPADIGNKVVFYGIELKLKNNTKYTLYADKNKIIYDDAVCPQEVKVLAYQLFNNSYVDKQLNNEKIKAMERNINNQHAKEEQPKKTVKETKKETETVTQAETKTEDTPKINFNISTKLNKKTGEFESKINIDGKEIIATRIPSENVFTVHADVNQLPEREREEILQKVSQAFDSLQANVRDVNDGRFIQEVRSHLKEDMLTDNHSVIKFYAVGKAIFVPEIVNGEKSVSVESADNKGKSTNIEWNNDDVAMTTNLAKGYALAIGNIPEKIPERNFIPISYKLNGEDIHVIFGHDFEKTLIGENKGNFIKLKGLEDHTISSISKICRILHGEHLAQYDEKDEIVKSITESVRGLSENEVIVSNGIAFRISEVDDEGKQKVIAVSIEDDKDPATITVEDGELNEENINTLLETLQYAPDDREELDLPDSHDEER